MKRRYVIGKEFAMNERETDFKIEEEYVSLIEMNYTRMSNTEKRIADFLLETDVDISKLSIKDFAMLVSTSEATIVRFARILGYIGYSDMKFHMQRRELIFDNSSKSDIYISIDDDINAIKQKVYTYAHESIKRSILSTPAESYDAAISALCNARNIYFCASGSASGIAMTGANLFLSLGISAYYFSDLSSQIRTLSLCQPSDVVIAINYDGYGIIAVDALMVAKSVGATTISITANKNSTLSRYADIELLTSSRKEANALNISTTAICQLTVIQTLQVGVWLKRYPDSNRDMTHQMDVSALTRYEDNTDSIAFGRVTQNNRADKKGLLQNDLNG